MWRPEGSPAGVEKIVKDFKGYKNQGSSVNKINAGQVRNSFHQSVKCASEVAGNLLFTSHNTIALIKL